MKEVAQSLDAVKKLDKDELQALWNCYYKNGKFLAQALWYAISYEQEGIAIEQKHNSHLKKYSRNPDMCITKAYPHKYHLKADSHIEKTYKGKQ